MTRLSINTSKKFFVFQVFVYCSTKGVTGSIRAGDSICELKPKGSLSSLKEYRKKSCYILQDDRLNPLFTVAELMKFAADMKLGDTLTDKLKLSVVSTRHILKCIFLQFGLYSLSLWCKVHQKYLTVLLSSI